MKLAGSAQNSRQPFIPPYSRQRVILMTYGCGHPKKDDALPTIGALPAACGLHVSPLRFLIISWIQHYISSVLAKSVARQECIHLILSGQNDWNYI